MNRTVPPYLRDPLLDRLNAWLLQAPGCLAGLFLAGLLAGIIVFLPWLVAWAWR